MYKIKELYKTIQGEGAQAGRGAVFLRFAGCNLWSGRGEDRATAICKFCDTDFRGTDGVLGGKYTAEDLAKAVADLWPVEERASAGDEPVLGVKPYVVCTGGEPLLQLDEPLVQALHERGFEVGVETNGTCEAVAGIDWLCVSPKAGAELVLKAGDELKLVYPQAGAEPELYASLDFEHFFLQPMDGPDLQAHTQAAVAYCLAHPQWRLSLQWHKIIGIP
ncbi:MAG TPA: 7-carboxy-7-deazaguanine synthase [Phaeodactylibacter sp.]|nr:7-carboxy-7-deazaguanine synthase [Phaeodactylibacter sp.]